MSGFIELNNSFMCKRGPNHKNKFNDVFQIYNVLLENPNNSGNPFIAAINEGRISLGLSKLYKSSEAFI